MQMATGKMGVSPDGKTVTLEEQRITAGKSKPAKKMNMGDMGVMGEMNSMSAKERDAAMKRMMDELDKTLGVTH